MTDRLQTLSEAGVSIWLDDLSRERIETGNLAELIKDKHVVGVTTNPTIFAGAIGNGERYDEQVRKLVADDADVNRVIFELTTEDVRNGCEIMTPVFESTKADGRVSIEVEPSLAHDTEATIASAQKLWQAVDRPNVYIKIPATLAGLPGDHRGDLAGDQRQRDADLQRGALPRGHGCLPERPRGGPRRRPRPEPDLLGGVVLRVPRRHRGGQAARRASGSDEAKACAARRRSPTRCSPTRRTTRSSRATAGSSSRTPAPTRSGRCGPRRA